MQARIAADTLKQGITDLSRSIRKAKDAVDSHVKAKHESEEATKANVIVKGVTEGNDFLEAMVLDAKRACAVTIDELDELQRGNGPDDLFWHHHLPADAEWPDIRKQAEPTLMQMNVEQLKSGITKVEQSLKDDKYLHAQAKHVQRGGRETKRWRTNTWRIAFCLHIQQLYETSCR